MNLTTKPQTPAQRVANPVWLRQQIAEWISDCQSTITAARFMADHAPDAVQRAIHHERATSHHFWKRQFERVLSGTMSEDALQTILTKPEVSP